MNARTLLLVALAIVAAAVGFSLLPDDRDALVPGGDTDAPAGVETLSEDAPPPPEAAVPAAVEPVAPPPARTALEDQPPREESEARQGVRGLVRDPFGRPLADADVYLLRGAGSNPFLAMTQAAKGVVHPPLAHARTDPDGRFTLGIASVEPPDFELCAVHPRYLEHRIPSLQIAAGEWHDLEPIALARGAVVKGRVVIAGSGGLPATGAQVFVKPSNDLAWTPTPGRERGLVATVDATGNYRFDNAPTGVVSVATVAPGYARSERASTVVAASRETEVDFELSPGATIAGKVVASTGAPIANATIVALSIGTQPQTAQTRSDADGRFALPGLREGPYTVYATAPGFVRREAKPVDAGKTDLELQLEPQGTARLRVLDKNGQPMSTYRVAVRQYREGHEHLGHTDHPVRSPRPDPSGVSTIEGLDPGSYVFEVQARDHAKAYSEPFAVALAAEPPLVEVRLNEGGTIEGVVRDALGAAVAGVTVTTVPNHFIDNPLIAALGALTPAKITRTGTQTDAKGHYRLRLLAPGTYQLRFTHPDYFEVSLRDRDVRSGAVLAIDDVRLAPGTLVSGVTRVAGKPTGQVKVTLSSLAPEPANAQPVVFQADATSDSNGEFTLPKRIPPGRYQVMAARQTQPNPLAAMSDYAKTKREIVLARGQRTLTLDFQIPAN